VVVVARITRWRAIVTGLLLLSVSWRVGSSGVAPSIEFSTVPEAAVGGPDGLAPIAGRVLGARSGQRIVLFARSERWWVQPVVTQPFTTIEPNATWKSTIHLGTEYAALLVDADYKPSAVVESLPARGGGVVAVASRKGSGTYVPRPRKMLTFSGYEWEIRQIPGDRGGANEYDARNSWVDPAGSLHLMLAQRDGRWTSAEVKLTRSLGYGTYSFAVQDTSRLDPAAALAMLTWDDLGADQHHRELDLEISRWGDPANKGAQYAVQPHYVAVNVFRFVAPPRRLAHSFHWEPSRVSFRTFTNIDGAALTGGGSIVVQHDFTSGVPLPGTETVRLNLCYFRASPAPPAATVEVVIERFEYLP
jgi:hypothetical protein